MCAEGAVKMSSRSIKSPIQQRQCKPSAVPLAEPAFSAMGGRAAERFLEGFLLVFALGADQRDSSG